MLDVAVAVAVLAGLSLAVDRVTAFDDIAGRARVADGDSIVIDGSRIRLQGIDAPELAQTCIREGKTYPCGQRARDALAALIDGDTVSCRSVGTDRYGRMLGQCMVGNSDLASQMVRDGWAIAYGSYQLDELAARRDDLGLLAGTFDTPQDWRRANDGLTEEFHAGGLVSALRERWYRLKAWMTGGGTS